MPHGESTAREASFGHTLECCGRELSVEESTTYIKKDGSM